MKTRITELLNIDYPIFQGGMAWVADGDLAGAVSKAGGLGIIGGGNAPKEVVKANIDKIKSLTDKPFGVNIMLLSPFVEDIVDLVIEEGVKVVTTGAGNPSKYMERFHEAGITVIPVVPSVALAKRMEKIGADAVIAEGMEAGGHIGKLTTMTLVRQVAAAVSIPVIAAGGIADGEGAAAGFMLGAEAIQVGTRFVVAKESNAHPNYKAKILKARDIDTTISAQHFGHAVRAIKNQLTRDFEQAEKDAFKQENPDLEIFEQMGAGALAKAVVHGDVDGGSVMAGQIAGLVSKAGGLGIIGGGNAPKEVVKANIDKIKSLTDKPFGVNIMLLSPFVEDIVDLVIEEGVKVVTTGAGNPSKYMERFHEAGITVIPVVPSVALAKRMEKIGADAVIAEGMEAGGHIGKLTTMTLVRQVAAAVSIPVIAAGGIADGEGAAAGFMLGAEAVQVGTRFVVAKESNAHPNYKAKILKARDIDTTISAQHFGHAVRAIKNQLTRDFEKAEKDAFKQENPDLEIFDQMGAGALAKAVVHGDVDGGSVMAGQIAGLVSKEETVEEILKDLYYGAAKKIQEEASRWAGVVRND